MPDGNTDLTVEPTAPAREGDTGRLSSRMIAAVQDVGAEPSAESDLATAASALANHLVQKLGNGNGNGNAAPYKKRKISALAALIVVLSGSPWLANYLLNNEAAAALEERRIEDIAGDMVDGAQEQIDRHDARLYEVEKKVEVIEAKQEAILKGIERIEDKL